MIEGLWVPSHSSLLSGICIRKYFKGTNVDGYGAFVENPPKLIAVKSSFLCEPQKLILAKFNIVFEPSKLIAAKLIFFFYNFERNTFYVLLM